MGQIVAAYRHHPHHGAVISQDIVGSWAGMSQAQISRLENGKPLRHLDQLERWARLLDIPKELRWFGTASALSAGREAIEPRSPVETSEDRDSMQSASRLCREGVLAYTRLSDVGRSQAVLDVAGAGVGGQTDEVLRRTLLATLAAYGIQANLAPGVSAFLVGAGPNRVSGGLVDEWHQACIEYGFDYHTRPRRELTQDLLADLIEMRGLLTFVNEDSQRRSVASIVARLAGMAALACTDLGYRREVKHLWRLGCRMADLAQDRAIQQWVHGHETTSGLYHGRPLPVVMAIADRGLTVGDAPTAGRAELLGGKAQALAVAGRHDEAGHTLELLQATFERLPDEITTFGQSIMGWSEQRLRHAESFVHATAGRLEPAMRAQDRALQLYPATRPISRTQIHLHRAECLIRAGHVSDGAAYARDALSGAPLDWRNRYVLAVALKVLDAVPDSQRYLPAVMGLHDEIAEAMTPALRNGRQP